MQSEHFKTHENSMLIFRNVIKCLTSGSDFYMLILGKFVLVRYVREEFGEVFQHDFTLKLSEEVQTDTKLFGFVTFDSDWDRKLPLQQIEGNCSVRSIRRKIELFECKTKN
ncbi:hypothetical protein HUJ05_005350 [Dendroctonus ponderosae]|nr:hypothetical protein HUJ05_005350 [Dendroctonus ponderosae]